jgi:hypothetical protein
MSVPHPQSLIYREEITNNEISIVDTHRGDPAVGTTPYRMNFVWTCGTDTFSADGLATQDKTADLQPIFDAMAADTDYADYWKGVVGYDDPTFQRHTGVITAPLRAGFHIKEGRDLVFNRAELSLPQESCHPGKITLDPLELEADVNAIRDFMGPLAAYYAVSIGFGGSITGLQAMGKTLPPYIVSAASRATAKRIDDFVINRLGITVIDQMDHLEAASYLTTNAAAGTLPRLGDGIAFYYGVRDALGQGALYVVRTPSWNIGAFGFIPYNYSSAYIDWSERLSPDTVTNYHESALPMAMMYPDVAGLGLNTSNGTVTADLQHFCIACNFAKNIPFDSWDNSGTINANVITNGTKVPSYRYTSGTSRYAIAVGAPNAVSSWGAQGFQGGFMQVSGNRAGPVTHRGFAEDAAENNPWAVELFGPIGMYSDFPGYRTPISAAWNANGVSATKCGYTERHEGANYTNSYRIWPTDLIMYLVVDSSVNEMVLEVNSAAATVDVGNKVVDCNLTVEAVKQLRTGVALRDYALYLKTVVPAKAAELDQLILDLDPYGDALFRSTYLATAMDGPFEVVKNTELYKLAQQAEEDLYNRALTENLTFKQAQNRVNTLVDQRMFVILADDVIDPVNILPVTIQPYVGLPDHFLGLGVDDQYAIVNAAGTVVLSITNVDAAYSYIAGLRLLDGDEITFVDLATVTADLELLLGGDLTYEQLYLGPNGQTSIYDLRPQAMADDRGYPIPHRLDTTDHLNRAWIILKGINQSTFEKTMMNILLTNPYQLQA